MKHKKYKTSNLPIYPNKDNEERKSFYDKQDYELIIDGDSVYEIDKECIECLKRKNVQDSNN